MKVCILSEDQNTASLATSFPVETAPLRGPIPDADLLVWEPRLVDDLPATLPGIPQIFILQAADVAPFHRRYPGTPARVLLKPLEPGLLDRALSEALTTPDTDPLQWLLLASWRLQERNAERVNFLARTLHDLRAPLTAACGYCGLLADKCLGTLAQAQAETVERMHRSLQRVSALASAAFQLSVGSAGIPEASLLPGSLEDCVEQAVSELGPTAEAKSIECTVRLSEPPEGLRFDSAQMIQVFSNLLDNACRFAAPGSSVSVTGYPVSQADGSWLPVAPSEAAAYRVDVSDSGPGIPPGRVADIFKEYVSYSATGDRAGTGLGLAICRLIVEAHHGEVFADSRPDGATFSVVLPSAPGALRARLAPVLRIADSPRFQVRR